MRRAFCIAVACLLAAPATAVAGTVSVAHGVDKLPGPHGTTELYPYATITYRAAQGEQNDVTLTALGHGAAVRDAGAPVTAGDGSARLDSVSGSEVAVRAVGGAGADTLRTADRGSSVHGSEGDDTIIGG